MHKKILLPLILILVLCILFGIWFFLDQSNPQSTLVPIGKTYEIALTPEGFSSGEVTLKHGDAVKFTAATGNPFWPASDLHPTHGIYPEFDAQEPIEPDKSWTFQFLKTGRWKFHDHLQPISRGVVIVQ